MASDASDPNGPGGPHDPLSGPLPPIPDPVPGRRRSRVVAPLATVAAVAVVAAGTGVLLSRGGTTGAENPPALRLSGVSLLAEPVAGIDQIRPVVSGTLPSGSDHGRVFRVGTERAPESLVADLARTFDLSGHPTRTSDSWLVRDGDRLLTVSDRPGWRWSYAASAEIPISGPPVRLPVVTPSKAPPAAPSATPPAPSDPGLPPEPIPNRTVPTMSCLVIVNGQRACPPATPLPRHGGTLAPGARIPEHPDGGTSGRAPDGSATGSAGASSSGSGSAGSTGSTGGSTGSLPASPASPKPTPDRDSILAAARPLLAALGLDGARLTVATSPGSGMVTADPRVAGLPTAGFATLLTFDSSPRPHLVLAAGWLADPHAGARYPLDPAGTVLRHMPRRCDPCVRTTARATVTGARLGLAMELDDRAVPLLVPAWLYDVRGSDRPLALVAVDPHFLAKPRPILRTVPPVPGSGSRAVAPVPPIGGARPPVSPTPRPTR